MALFSVLFDIAAKTASFDASMARIESAFDRIGEVARAAGEVIGVSLSAASMVEFTNRAIDAGDEIFRLSQKAGTSAQAFSQLSYAAKSSGVDVGSLSAAFARMQDSISKASSGNYGMTYLFEEIGVSVAGLKQLAPDKQFEAIAQAISQIPDPSNRARAAIEVFGRSGAELLPLLVQGAGGIDKLRATADQLGVTLTNLTAEQLHDAKEAIDKMNASFSGLWTTLAAKLSPSLSYAADQLRQLTGGSTDVEKLQQSIESLRIAQGEAAQNSDFDDVEKYGKQIDAIQATIDAAQKKVAASVAPEDVKIGLANALGFGPDSLQEIKIQSKRWLPTTQDILAEYYDQMDKDTGTEQEKLLIRTREFYFEIGELVHKGLDPSIATTRIQNFLATTAVPPIEAINPTVKHIQTETEKTAQAMADTVTAASQTMAQGFYQFFLNPADVGIKGLAKDFIVAIEQMIAKQATLTLFGADNQSGSIGGLFSTLFGALGGQGGGSGFSVGTNSGFDPAQITGGAALSSILDIPFLAGGGTASGGRSYLVGEQGPELFTPGATGTVTPNDALGGGAVHITQTIDARGATVDAVQLLPGAMKKATADAVNQVMAMRRRGQL